MVGGTGLMTESCTSIWAEIFIWIRSFLVLQNYLVDPVRCIICTEDKPLQKCIYPNPVLVYFYCSPRAVDKQTWSAICDFESESLKNISIWVPLQLSERHNICETQSIVILYKVCHTKLNVIQSILNTSTADKCALHCTDISDYKHLHHCIVVKTPSKTM